MFALTKLLPSPDVLEVTTQTLPPSLLLRTWYSFDRNALNCSPMAKLPRSFVITFAVDDS